MRKPKNHGWELLSEADQARLTYRMRELSPAQFMLGMRICDARVSHEEIQLLVRWKDAYEAHCRLETDAAFANVLSACDGPE